MEYKQLSRVHTHCNVKCTSAVLKVPLSWFTKLHYVMVKTTIVVLYVFRKM